MNCNYIAIQICTLILLLQDSKNKIAVGHHKICIIRITVALKNKSFDVCTHRICMNVLIQTCIRMYAYSKIYDVIMRG